MIRRDVNSRSIVLPIELHINLRDVGIRDHIVDWSVGLDGEILVLTTEQCFKIHHEHCSPISLPDTRDKFRFVRRMNERELLLVCDRLRKSDSTDAVMVDELGQELRRVHIGEYAQQILVGSDESIWVGYGDQGYKQQTSRNGGIVQIDREGKAMYSYEAMDCYAMTLAHDGSIYAYTYPSHLVIHKPHNGRTSNLGTCPRKGSHTLAVRKNTLLLDGGYENPGSLYATAIDNMEAMPITLTGESVPHDLRDSFAIGTALFFLFDHAIYEIDVPDLY